MKDVAEYAGVSLSTVSYVLNDTGAVAPDRRNRVLDAIRILDYEVNESARNLKRRSGSAIGVVIPELTNQFFALIAEGVQKAAAARNILVVLVVPGNAGQPEEEQSKLLRSQRIDGVIYSPGIGSTPASVSELAQCGPLVLVDERIPGMDLPAVVCDSRRGARAVAAHVLAQGHTRLAVLGGPPALWTAQQRLAGYREGFAGAGLDPDEVPVFDGDYKQMSGRELAAKALAGYPRPTALLCANDLMAIGAMEYCREVGLRVPEDVSIAGFDDLPMSGLLNPRLTTVYHPAQTMGFVAATALFAILDNGEAGSIDMLPTSLRVRDSVCSPQECR